MNDSLLMALEIIGTIIIVVGIYLFMVYHKLGQMTIRVEEEARPLRDWYEKRYPLLTDLISCIREDGVREKKAVMDAVNARAAASRAKDKWSMIACEARYSLALAKLLLILKNYPILREDEWYVDIIRQFDRVNSHLDETGQKYNKMAKSYNELVGTHPSKLVAQWRKCEKVPMYLTWEEAQSSAEGRKEEVRMPLPKAKKKKKERVL